MDRKIEGVRHITITEDDIEIYYDNESTGFKREYWSLTADNISELRSGVVEEDRIRFARTVIYFKPGSEISCQILEDEREILCSERPEKWMRSKNIHKLE